MLSETCIAVGNRIFCGFKILILPKSNHICQIYLGHLQLFLGITRHQQSSVLNPAYNS